MGVVGWVGELIGWGVIEWVVVIGWVGGGDEWWWWVVTMSGGRWGVGGRAVGVG